jgi:hypothetical protein
LLPCCDTINLAMNLSLYLSPRKSCRFHCVCSEIA